MPYVSMFFGIIIRMFHNDHSPPHFHAEYQGQRGVFDFNGNMTRGYYSVENGEEAYKRWANLHNEELLENWKNATRDAQINKIAPLD